MIVGTRKELVFFPVAQFITILILEPELLVGEFNDFILAGWCLSI